MYIKLLNKNSNRFSYVKFSFYLQMGKQTMGTPCHALRYRSDNKLYRIQTPQTPMVRPGMHDYYDIDNYPMGTNAIVAVISYTVSSYRH